MEGFELLRKVLNSNLRWAQAHENAVKSAVMGQNPRVTAVFCSDSRVNEASFARDAFNYLFVIENAGNLAVNNLESVKYGVLHLGTPLLLIVGHTECGAIYEAMKIVREGKEAPEEFRFLVELAKKHMEKFEGLSDNEINARLAELSVDEQIRKLLEDEEIHRKVEAGELLIAGAIFEIRPYLVGHGRLRIININGSADAEKIKEEFGIEIQRLTGLQ